MSIVDVGSNNGVSDAAGKASFEVSVAQATSWLMVPEKLSAATSPS